MYIGILVYLAFIFIVFKEKNNRVFLASLLPLVLIIWTRYGIGADYFSYNYIYNVFDASTIGNVFTSDLEIGYNFIMYLSKTIGIGYHVFSSLFASLILLFYILWIKDNSENIYLSVLILYSMFFVVWVLSALRQGLVMSLGMYLFYNQKKDIGIMKKVLIVLLLSTIHFSALVFLLFIAFEHLELTKRNHIIITIITIVLSYTIVKIVPSFIQYIPVLSGNQYVVNMDKTWALFPAIIRIIMFTAAMLFYDTFEKDKFYKKLINVHLLSYPLYFILKFSEIVAGRVFAYSFILIIILVPFGIKTIKKESHKLIATALLIFMSLLFLIKDLNAYQYQVGYIKSNNFYSYQTIFNKDSSSFHNIFTFLVTKDEITEDFIQNSLENYRTQKVTLKSPVVVKLNNEFRILDEHGQHIEGLTFDLEPKVYDDFIEVKCSNQGYIETKYMYFNKTEPLATHVIDVKQKLINSEVMNSYNYIQYSNPKVHELSTSVRKFFNTSIDGAHMFHFETPFKYYMLEIEYMQRKFYFLLDENKELIVDLILSKPVFFDKSGMAVIELDDTDIFIDSSGKVVWINEK